MSNPRASSDRLVPRRILVSAYGCEPGKGSEQGVGWNWVLQLAELAELVVITRSNNRLAIEAALPSSLVERVRFEYHDLPQAVRRFKRREKGLYLYYLMWQWGAYRRARDLVMRSHFDYAMHLTFGSIWLPTFMHRLPLPLIWGPVGGGEAVPFGLIGALPARGRGAQYLRHLLMATASVNPLLMSVVRQAEVILARTSDTARVVPVRYAARVRPILETGIAEELLARKRHKRVDAFGRLRVIYTGRLIALKNVAAAIQAVAGARARGVDLQFSIVGDGPLRESLEALAVRLGVSGCINFHGPVSQMEVIKRLEQSDVYLFPSLKEAGVWSLMEAMSAGLATVCVDTSGMAVITDEKSAIRVAAESQERLIDGFTQALVDLAESPELRRQLGANARKRIETCFRWHHKAEFMRMLFNELEGR